MVSYDLHGAGILGDYNITKCYLSALDLVIYSFSQLYTEILCLMIPSTIRR